MAYLVMGFTQGAGTITPWDITSLVDTGQSLSVSAQSFSGRGLRASPDGTKLYYVSNSNGIFQYALSTPWDISTASYDNKNLSSPSGTCAVAFKTDGTKAFVANLTSDDITAYTLSAPWDISTATADGVTRATEEPNPYGLDFKPDGTKMFIAGPSNDLIREYALSTPWDISTATLTASASTYPPQFHPRGMQFSSDGMYLFQVGDATDDITRFPLTTPWDVSTMGAYDQISLHDFTSPFGVVVSGDGLQVFILEDGTDLVRQFAVA